MTREKGSALRRVLAPLLCAQLFCGCYASLPPIKTGEKFEDARDAAKAQARKDVHSIAWGFGGALSVLTYVPLIPVAAGYATPASPTANSIAGMDAETARYYGDVYGQAIRDRRVKAVWTGWSVTLITALGVGAVLMAKNGF